MDSLTIHSSAVTDSCPPVAPTLRLTPDQLAHYNDDSDNHFEDYAPEWDADRYVPTPEALAESDGFGHGYEFNHAAQPTAAMPDLLKVVWFAGKADGIAQRRADIEEADRYHAEMSEWAFESIQTAIHEDEVVRALGVIASRERGAL